MTFLPCLLSFYILIYSFSCDVWLVYYCAQSKLNSSYIQHYRDGSIILTYLVFFNNNANVTNATVNTNFVNAVKNADGRIGQYMVNLTTVRHGGNHLITCCLVLHVYYKKSKSFFQIHCVLIDFQWLFL